MDSISLSGVWDFRFDDETAWRGIGVPGCWEMLDVPKDCPGPAWYRTRFVIPQEWAGRRLWLRFGAVSYHCAIWVNGREVGQHTGLWDSFVVEITAAAAPGQPAELLVRVEKPAGLERGPGSGALPGSFPLKETLSGFLPYVWGQIFGGIWQEVELAATGRVVFEDVYVRGDADGRVRVEATLSAPGVVTLEIRDPDGALVLSTTAPPHPPASQPPLPLSPSPPLPAWERGPGGERATNIHFEVAIPNPRPWAPWAPALYQTRLRTADGDERTVRFGLRTLHVDGTTLLLNGHPLYPRLALSWGWYPDALHSNPGPARVRDDFERLRRLGYNGVKLCLWFPPQYYFDLADELGMLLWVELPMWLPQPTTFFRRQTPAEYERLVRLARPHPSVILYSLGCELGRQVGADILAPLYALVKTLAGDALVRDNSGSGEAYGGLLNEFADYYDYHFYAEPQFFRDLIDYFTPRWRPALPWVFGEFCEADTFRDLRRLADRRPPTADHRPPTADRRPPTADHRGGEEERGRRGEEETDSSPPLPLSPSPPLPLSLSSDDRLWWTLNDPWRNPQGARWLYEIVAQEQRLRASGLWERGEELERVSRRQALLHRKFILELVRSYREVSGYVVTGEADTPINTAGMWDDQGRLKFEPAEFRAFNADLVVLVGWDRRRAWVAGGDRAAPWDTWSYAAGALVRPHMVVSHYGAAHGPAHVTWSVEFAGEAPFAQGAATTPFTLAPGALREVAIAEFAAPTVGRPRQATLRATVQVGHEEAENQWPLWFFPRDAWSDAGEVALVDPSGRLSDLATLAPALRDTLDAAAVVIATDWIPEVAAFVARGGRAVLLLAGAGTQGPIRTVQRSFWREAIRIAEPHPAWGDFPLDESGWQFFGCATDEALDTGALPQAIPIYRRLDARTMSLDAYAAEIPWGAGWAIVTTLRFQGGQGSQPLGIARNTAAAYLLRCWARYLQQSGSEP